MKNRENGFAHLGLILFLVLVVGFIGFAGWKVLQNKDGKSGSSSAARKNDVFLGQYGQGCKDRPVSFTSPPLKLSDLSYIRPLGAMGDSHVTPTDHVYVGPPNLNAPDNSYAVLMPADGTITGVSAMPAQYIGDRTDVQKGGYEDHNIMISHSCRFFTNFIHIHKLSDKLRQAVGTLKPGERRSASVELKAGDVVGYIGGNTFDWIPIDTSTKLKGFITPKLYEGEAWKIHVVSAFDLYSEPLKSQLEAKSQRSVAPLGGMIDYDVAGTLQGNWFRKGTNGYKGNNQSRPWDGHLTIAPDSLDPKYTIFSTGNWTGSAKQFLLSATLDPVSINSESGFQVFDLRRLSYIGPSNGLSPLGQAEKGLHPAADNPIEGAVAVQVLPGEMLKVEKFPAKSASQVRGFTSAAEMYER